MSEAALVERVEALLAEAEGRADTVALQLAQAMLELYGEGLERFVGCVAERDADGSLARAVAADELVSHLLLVHGLHPVPLPERVQAALDEVRPYMASHGGSVELIGAKDGVARVRLEGSCHGCPSSALTLKLAIEEAVLKAAPDVERVEAVELPEAPAPLLQIEVPAAWTQPCPAAVEGGPP